jgi:hypothetical protein
MNTQPYKYIWTHCDNTLAVTFSYAELEQELSKQLYVQPNREKLQQELAQKDSFTYGLGMFKIQRIKI